MYKEVFQLRIKQIRLERKFSQTESSKGIEISQPLLSKFESGEREPNLEDLGKLANFYEVSIDWLLGNPYGARKRRDK